MLVDEGRGREEGVDDFGDQLVIRSVGSSDAVPKITEDRSKDFTSVAEPILFSLKTAL